MSSTGSIKTQETQTDMVPSRPWKTVYNKRFGHWVIHHHVWCERGETSTLLTIHTTLNDEKDAAVAAFVVAAVNAYQPPDPRGCLPDCMMPDGADPCIGYHAALDRVRSLETHARFLLDRLQEFDPGDFDADREFNGHVAPAIARLKTALAS